MRFVFDGYEISAATAKILADADRASRQQEEREEQEREARRWHAMTVAPLIRAQLEADRDRMEAEAARAERLEERKRQEKIAAARDHAELLVASGQARWRTVAEVLEASRSYP
jgi:uncharacterized membrane-anchored protein